MALHEILADRTAAVAQLKPAQLAQFISLQPHIAAWSLGLGPLQNLRGRHQPKPSRSQLAAVLADPHTIRVTLDLLSPGAFQLVVTAASHGGTLTPHDVDIELDPLPPDHRANLIAELTERLIIDPARGYVALRPGIADLIGRPGRPLDRLLLDQSVNSQRLADWLHRLDVHPIPAKKGARIDALHSVFGNAERLQELLNSLGKPQLTMFSRLLTAGGRGESIERLGVQWWQLRLHQAYNPRHVRPTVDPVTAALQDLFDLGLVWIEEGMHYVGLWLEVLTTVSGRTFASWPARHDVEPQPISHSTDQLPAVLSALHGLLHHVGTEPLPGLKSGGLGVKPVRDLAKRLGLPEAGVALLVRLAVGLGLVVELTEYTGTGRHASWVHRFETDREQVASWNATSAGDQWRGLVSSWLDGVDVPSDQRVLVPMARRQMVADLLALAVERGVPVASVHQWFEQAHVLASRVEVDPLLAHLVMLDLVPSSGPIGLTPLARLVLTEPEQLSTRLPDGDHTFVVQGDLTVVAPPALHPSIRSRLDRICTVESSGSVTVLRLDRTRIAAQMAGGETAPSLLSFLETHSSVPVAAIVAQMLADVERARGGLSVVSAATVVTADDVLGLAEAVKVRAARLTLIAPTVAISDLPIAKVITALRTKGLAPSNIGLKATELDDTHHPDRMVHRVAPRPRSTASSIHPHIEQLERIVESW